MALYPFNPPPNAPFQFQPVLDRRTYSGIVNWNLFGQRYYLNLFDGAGTRIFTKALIGSPTGKPIQSLEWNLQGLVKITTIDPHGYRIGSTLDLTISGAVPAAYNGKRLCLVTGPDTISFPLLGDPGQASIMGVISYNIDLVWGYGFNTSLIYRDAAQQFETI